jgi:predicted nucleic acid-binding Zn ribbon protein
MIDMIKPIDNKITCVVCGKEVTFFGKKKRVTCSKQCSLEYEKNRTKSWRKTNPEYNVQYMRWWRDKNRERVVQLAKSFRDKNSKMLNVRGRINRAAHKILKKRHLKEYNEIREMIISKAKQKYTIYKR